MAANTATATALLTDLHTVAAARHQELSYLYPKGKRTAAADCVASFAHRIIELLAVGGQDETIAYVFGFIPADAKRAGITVDTAALAAALGL